MDMAAVISPSLALELLAILAALSGGWWATTKLDLAAETRQNQPPHLAGQLDAPLTMTTTARP